MLPARAPSASYRDPRQVNDFAPAKEPPVYPRIHDLNSNAEGPPPESGTAASIGQGDGNHGTATGVFTARFRILADGRLGLDYAGQMCAFGMRVMPPEPPEVSRLGLVPISQQEHQSSSRDANGREVFTTAWAKTYAEASGGEQTGSNGNSNGTATHQAG